MTRSIWTWASNAHPLFWLLVAGLIPATVGAVAVHPRSPGYALNSDFIYRAEVGTATYVLFYALVLLLWLGYQGRSVNIQLPGGGGVSTPDPGLSDAADAFEEFQKSTKARLDAHDDALEDLDRRVSAADAPKP
ncbi:MAG TPA: hypothetical protein VGC59_04815 [Solirubrobacteraceae bacterium]